MGQSRSPATASPSPGDSLSNRMQTAQKDRTSRRPPDPPEALPASPMAATQPYKRCPFCQGQSHFKYTREQVAMECATRQYTAQTNCVVTIDDPQTFIAYGQWLLNTTVVVFAYNQSRSASSRQGPHQSSEASATPLGQKAISEPEPVKTLPAVVPSVATLVTPKKPIPDGTYTGILAWHAMKTPGRMKFVNPDLMGRDGGGVWITTRDANLIQKIAKCDMNDRIRVKLSQGVIVRFTRLDKITVVTKVTPGIKKGTVRTRAGIVSARRPRNAKG